MLDDQILADAINNSPLTDQDKDHWVSLLPKLNQGQREQLFHSLTAKTEIARAIDLIERALAIIAQAEEEAETEVRTEEEKAKEKQDLLKELEAIRESEDEILLDEETLLKKQVENQAQIEKIREELRHLSMEVHGEPPPSAQVSPQ